MVEIIAFIAFFIGGAIAVTIIVRKMPQAIAGVGIDRGSRLGWRANVIQIVEKIKHHPRVRNFSWMEFLQKQLLKARVAILKIDNKINDLTAKLRKRREKKNQENQVAAENYWRDLKGIVKSKKFSPRVKTKSAAMAETVIIEGVDASTSRESLKEALAVKKTALPEILEQRHVKASKKQGAKRKKTRIKAENKNPFSW